MKKLLCVLIACLLIVVPLVACADPTPPPQTGGDAPATSEPANDNESDPEDAAAEPLPMNSFRIAIPLPDTGAPMFEIMSNNVHQLANLMGGEVIFERTPMTPDGVISFVENQIAAGADGLVILPPADAILPAIVAIMEEAKVYWSITFRDILDDDIRAMVESSNYYVGRTFQDEAFAGYSLMQHLNSLGKSRVAIISTVRGDTTGDQREAGVMRAAEDFGMEVVAEARGLEQAADATRAAESFMAAHADLDAIIILATTATGSHDAVAKAIVDSGRADQIKLAFVDFQATMDEMFEENVLVAAAGLSHWGYDPFMTFARVANAASGHRIGDSNFSTSMEMTVITNLERAQAFLSIFGDPNAMYYTDDEMRELIRAMNPNLTPEEFNKIAAEFAPY